jgi:hypothetical protein
MILWEGEPVCFLACHTNVGFRRKPTLQVPPVGREGPIGDTALGGKAIRPESPPRLRSVLSALSGL